MIAEKILRYAGSAARRPDRALIAAFSELTQLPLRVEFEMDGAGSLEGVLPDVISRYMYLMEGIRGYEPETAAMMKTVIKPSNSVLVVGAHIGVHAVVAKQLTGESGAVVGFEPTPETFSILAKNCEGRNISVEPIALTRHGIDQITMTIFDVRHSAWNSGLKPRSNKAEQWKPKSIVVPATSIDSYCEVKGFFPDVFILDLENGEMDALLGAERTIKNHHPSIIIECGDSGREQWNSTSACLGLLNGEGYELFEANSQTGNLSPHAIMPTYPDDYPNLLAVEKSKSIALF